MLDQKVEHVHNNPVEEGLVTLPEHYAYSSAHPASVLKCSGMRIEKAGGREGGGTRQTAERRVGVVNFTLQPGQTFNMTVTGNPSAGAADQFGLDGTVTTTTQARVVPRP